jgi:hypothetical protein
MEEQHNLKTSHTFAVLEAFIQMQDAIRQGAPPKELTDCSVVDYPPTEENIYELWGDEDTT